MNTWEKRMRLKMHNGKQSMTSQSNPWHKFTGHRLSVRLADHNDQQTINSNTNTDTNTNSVALAASKTNKEKSLNQHHNSPRSGFAFAVLPITMINKQYQRHQINLKNK
jgi:hypothetical protein